MALHHSPKIVTDGLVLCLDAKNQKSYNGTGTTWSDISGNDRNATMLGTMAISGGTSTIANVTNDYATIPHDATISSEVFGTSENFTLSSWFRVSSFQNWTCMISKAAGGSWSNTTAGLWVESSGTLRFVMGSNESGNPTGSYINPGFAVSLNTWYLATGVADGTNATLYINGEYKIQETIASITRTRSENTQPITIGRRSTATAPSHLGDIATVLVHNKALTAAEVLQMFNATRARFGI